MPGPPRGGQRVATGHFKKPRLARGRHNRADDPLLLVRRALLVDEIDDHKLTSAQVPSFDS